MKNLRLKFTVLLTLFVMSVPSLHANDFGISDTKMNEITNRVSSMNYDGLVATRSGLIAEQRNLEAMQDNTQSPSQNKAISSRLKEITAELSAIQKALIALVGAAAVSALTDDGYDDTIPPVITINGENPALSFPCFSYSL